MTRKTKVFANIFSKNRAEELGYDVWEYFVVPPYFDKLDLNDATKPRVIIGGRGCGKTMLLRYLSHQSTFSKKREFFKETELPHIGLYWKVDTQFANAMTLRDVPTDKWNSAFNHFAALIISIDVLESLESIVNSKSHYVANEELINLNFDSLKYFDQNLNLSYENLLGYLKGQLWLFVGWVNDVRKQKEPLFLPGVQFIKAVIEIITNQINSLKDAKFFVYVDEFENLLDYQKYIINTWLKHSELPLIFNLAVKRNAFDKRDTLGTEMISDVNDYRSIDLESYLFEDSFEVFSAEILLLKLSLSKIFESPIDINLLRNPDKLDFRKDTIYKDTVLTTAKSLFPYFTQKELAIQVFKDKVLSKKLFNKIERALMYKKSKINPKTLFRADYAEATIIIPSLIFRKKLPMIEIQKEFQKLLMGKENRFTGKTNWIHNNFVDCLLQLYAPYSRSCPFYSGFRTFCLLAHGNIRHFLEMCYKSLSRSLSEDDTIQFPIDPIQQAEGARQASASLLSEIRSFGNQGNRIHTFVLRLGSIFELARESSGTNIAEQTHFSISSGNTKLTDEDKDFLNENLKYSVLFESKATKTKSKVDPEIEYVMNPIYSPYFHISYRKKRKLELSSDQFITLIRGSIDSFKELAKDLERRWLIKDEESPQTIFSFVMEE